jgi:hypothetical protein
MGILRTDKISGLETPTAVTGSVSFDGSGDYLSLASSTDFSFSHDFTVEAWAYPTDISSKYNAIFSLNVNGEWNSQGNGFILSIGNVHYGTGYNTDYNHGIISINTWTHLAVTRSNGAIKIFVNGVLDQTINDGNSDDTFANGTGNTPAIGLFDQQGGTPRFYFTGYISNLRVLKGTALYTSDFTPSVHELEVIGDTVLLCCNNPDSAGAEATGKTITVNGDAAASTVSPGLTRDFTFGTQFEGVAKFDTQGYFVPPSGTTEQRGRGRGVFGGAYAIPAGANIKIEYIETSSSGNALEFGEMSSVAVMATALADSTRSVFAGGYSAPVPINTIEFITISTTSNTTNFGDLSGVRRHMASCASNTKGVWSGGTTTGSTNCVATMDNVTIQSLGNAVDYGDLSAARRSHGGASSPTRGVFAAGNTNTPTPTAAMNIIDYITIASGGTAQDFGDRTVTLREIGASSDSTRMVMGGGYEPANSNAIDYITIASTGNAQDFGDLFLARTYVSGLSNSIRGIFGGGSISPNYSNTIDYVTIQSTGNATDFGDLNQPRLGYPNAACDSHGGLS